MPLKDVLQIKLIKGEQPDPTKPVKVVTLDSWILEKPDQAVVVNLGEITSIFAGESPVAAAVIFQMIDFEGNFEFTASAGLTIEYHEDGEEPIPERLKGDGRSYMSFRNPQNGLLVCISKV